MSVGSDTQFFTIADRNFFPGLVALVNSLRLTGNAGTVVVLDQGLTSDQCDVLDGHASVVTLPEDDRGHPMLVKAFPHVLGATGTIVLIDSDLIVTASLSDIIRQAEAGSVCAFPNHRLNQARWFAEWEEIFKLPSPPRRQTYLNSGFVCFSTDHWPELLRIYWEACSRVPIGDIGRGGDENPVFESDQDALNAILMSVVPPERIARLPHHGMTYRDELVRARIVDESRLTCTLDGDRTSLLHYTRGPKPWQRSNWKRLRRDAFTILMPRLLFADDIPIRLESDAVPVWLRPGATGKGALRAIDLAHQAVAPAWRRLRATHVFSAISR